MIQLIRSVYFAGVAIIAIGISPHLSARVICSPLDGVCVTVPENTQTPKQASGPASSVLVDNNRDIISLPRAAVLPMAEFADDVEEGVFDQPTPARPQFVPTLQLAASLPQTKQEVGFGLLDQLLERREGVITQIDAMAADVVELSRIPGVEHSEEFQQQQQSLTANLQKLAELDVQIEALRGREDTTSAPLMSSEADDPYDFQLDDDDDDDVDGIGDMNPSPVALPTLVVQREEAENVEADARQNPCVRGDEPGCVDLTGMGHPIS